MCIKEEEVFHRILHANLHCMVSRLDLHMLGSHGMPGFPTVLEGASCPHYALKSPESPSGKGRRGDPKDEALRTYRRTKSASGSAESETRPLFAVQFSDTIRRPLEGIN